MIPAPVGVGRPGPERGERPAVVGRQGQAGRVQRATGDRDDGRPAVEVEAHGAVLRGRGVSSIVRVGRGRDSRTVECPRRCLTCLPPSSSRSSAAPPWPTPTASSGSRAASPVSAPPATTSSSSSRRWAIPRTSCSAWRPPSPTIRTRASSTSCSRPASTRARPCCRWPSTAWASPAISLTGPQAGITTDGRYGRARIADIEPRRVRQELADGRVVIVAGFQGQSAAAVGNSEITTLGRGGSDTTAVALAAALGADRCQIFTDVRGIYTADPRMVPHARQLHIIGYEEMLELAHQGAQVMQVRAVELGWVNDVVIEVLSSFEDAPGTLIKEDPLVEQRNKVRGLAHDRNVAKVTVNAVPDRPGVAHAIFDPLAEAGINVDMIVQNVGHGGTTDMSFTVPARRARPGPQGPRPGRARPRGPRPDDRCVRRQGVDRRGRPAQRPGLRGPDVRGARRREGQHRDDLDVRGPDHLHRRRGRARDGPARAARRLRTRTARGRGRAVATDVAAAG